MSHQHAETASRSRRPQEFPEDRYDRIPHRTRVGVHRVIARPRYFWNYLIAALLGFALLTTLGIIAVHQIGDSGKLQLPSQAAETPTEDAADPVLDPEARVAVLNGTETPNLAAALDQLITENQWGTMVFAGSAASSDVAISAVFYADPADASAAAGLAAELGGLSTYTSDDYADYDAQLIVLIGADYAGPGAEEAAQITENEGSTDLSTDDGSAAEIDPATGWEIDPASGYPIDPATGLPTDTATGLVIDPASGQLVDPSALLGSTTG